MVEPILFMKQSWIETLGTREVQKALLTCILIFFGLAAVIGVLLYLLNLVSVISFEMGSYTFLTLWFFAEILTNFFSVVLICWIYMKIAQRLLEIKSLYEAMSKRDDVSVVFTRLRKLRFLLYFVLAIFVVLTLLWKLFFNWVIAFSYVIPIFFASVLTEIHNLDKDKEYQDLKYWNFGVAFFTLYLLLNYLL